jgi:hypothetical protein
MKAKAGLLPITEASRGYLPNQATAGLFVDETRLRERVSQP